jgi:hydrogenase maturation protease
MTGSLLANIPGAGAIPLAIRSPRILVIGYGNPGRQDDGLGPAAAAEIEKIGWSNVTTLDNYQLVIEDAIQIAAHDVVWFVDAGREGDAPCAVHRLTPALNFTFTSHLLQPEALLAIAGQQFGRSADGHLVSIRGYEFNFLEGLSHRGQHNLALAVALLRRRIGYLSRVSR